MSAVDEKNLTRISSPVKGGRPPDREFYFKSNPQKRVWKVQGMDLYYSKEGPYRVYQRIDPWELEEAQWSRAIHEDLSRRQLLGYGAAAILGAALSGTLTSYFASPQIRTAPSPQPVTQTVTQTVTESLPVLVESFSRKRITKLSQLVEGQPVDFTYPLDHFQHTNFIVKLGTPAIGGVGPDGDVVAFNYMCTHMGCPLIGLYDDAHKMLGPCACHFTRFDLTKNGMVILGQATENLPQILLEVEDDDIYAAGVMRLICGFRANLKDAKRLEVA